MSHDKKDLEKKVKETNKKAEAVNKKAEEVKNQVEDVKDKVEAKEKAKLSVGEDEGVLQVKINTNERFIIDACFTDDFGNEAPVKDVPVWETSDAEVVTLIPSEDGLHCDVRPAGKLGDATVTVFAFGQDDEEIHKDVDVTVVLNFASQVDVEVSNPEVFN